VLTLLTTTDEKKAATIASSVDKLNQRRKLIEESVRKACLSELQASPEFFHAPAFAVYGQEFHQGVIGIAAQRLVEEFHRPAAVMAPGEALIGGQKIPVVKGSVRSIPGFHVAEALKSLGTVLLSCGGHAQAGGFTLSFDKLAEFRQRFVEKAGQCLSTEQLARRVKADVRAALSSIDFELAVEFASLAPFGVANPSPVLVSEGVTVDAVTMLGDKHLKVRFSDDVCSRNAVCWRMSEHPLLRKGERVNMAYQVELNTYKGVSSVQLNIKELWK
jgi:single-stranded-DNA-specific exonuclease